MSQGIGRCFVDVACGCKIIPNEHPNVDYTLIQGNPPALLFDYGCFVILPVAPDKIIECSEFVFFGGKPVARFGDKTIDNCTVQPGAPFFVFAG